MADLNKLIKVRGGVRSIFTKIHERITKLDKDTEEFEKGFVQLGHLNSRLETLNDEILDLIDEDEDIESEIENASLYTSKFLLIKRKVDCKDDRYQDNSKGRKKLNVRLPEIKMPTFDGDCLQFISFLELFTNCIDARNDISDIEKFSYLKNLLKGEAARAIEGLAIVSANYQNALDILVKRFGSKSKIISAHVQELLQLPVLQSVNGGGLRSLCDHIEVHVRALTTMGVAAEEYSCFLVQIVLSRLPKSLRLGWARQKESENLKVTELMEFLHGEAKAQENSLVNDQSHSGAQSSITSVRSNKKSNRYGSTSTFTMNNATTSVACHKCLEQHYLNRCPQFLNLSVEDRKRFIRDKNLCYRCFGNHLVGSCKSNFGCMTCHSKYHHSLLHFNRESKMCHTSTSRRDEASSDEIVNVGVSCSSREKVSVAVLPTLLVTVGGRRSKQMRFLLDSGSQMTFIKRDLARELELDVIDYCNLNVSGFGETNVTIDKCAKVGLRMKKGDRVVDLVAYESDKVCSQMKVMVDKDKLPQNVELADKYEDDNMVIDGIIGNDQVCKILTGKIVRFEDNLVGIETVFGFCLCGTAPSNHDSIRRTFSNHIITNEIQDLRRLWDLESIGIAAKRTDINRTDVQSEFVSNMTKENGRYLVSWPLKDTTALSSLDSYEVEAKSRLLRTLKRLHGNQSLHKKYDSILRDYEHDGIIERVPANQLSVDHAIRYLPHHPVVTGNIDNQKVRIVFDASAKDSNNVSLNDLMNTGPNLNPESTEILLRFRMRKFVITCDMKAAFLQIGLKENDKDLVRFLWLEDGSDLSSKIIPYRMNRVVFGAKSSPFILASVLREHFRIACQDMDSAEKLSRNFYVDDFIISLDTEDECKVMSNQVTNVISEMRGTLSKWHSNCEVVHNEKSTDSNDEVKVLGLMWHHEDDELKINSKIVMDQSEMFAPKTKRQLLHKLASLFDPLGFISPYIMTGKIILQDLWRDGNGWDEEMSDGNTCRVQAWWMDMEKISNMRFPRWIGYSSSDQVDLYGFSDASEKGLGCIIYSKITSRDGRVTTNFIMSKSRVAPIKRMSIPRLELTAALLCSRLMTYVQGAIEIKTKRHFFTDSLIALGWIRGDANRWKSYVQNRVTEIQELTDPEDWLFVPGTCNPADVLSRGTTSLAFCNSPSWLQGPAEMGFSDAKEMWPVEDLTQKVKSCISHSIMMEQVATCTCNSISVVEPAIDIEHFSNYKNLIRVVAWVLRFVNNSRRKTSNKEKFITGEEMKKAELKIISLEQRKSFSNELKCLKEDKIFDASSRISQLQPFLCEKNLIRKGGRIEFSTLTFDEKFPIILDYRSHLTYLIIKDRHECLMHASIRDTMMDLRSKFWILRCRSSIKSVIHECNLCKRKSALPYQPNYCPLPPDRVTEMNFVPFLSTGLDYMGPFKVKEAGSIMKCYVLLFTCARIRAIHLECLKSLDLATFICTFEVFAARRGKPQLIRSDNFKTFKAAAPILSSRYQIEWKFNTPGAPWQGGFFERLVKSVKTPLRSYLLKKVITFDNFRHRITLIEHAINSRPITAMYDNVTDPRPISPNDFLMHRGLSLAENIDQKDVVRESFLVSLKYYRFIWTRWRKEYLRMLQSENRKRNTREPKIGDVVLLESDGSKLTWPLAVIEELMPGRDGKVRTARIKTSNQSYYTRPIQKLYLLEI